MSPSQKLSNHRSKFLSGQNELSSVLAPISQTFEDVSRNLSVRAYSQTNRALYSNDQISKFLVEKDKVDEVFFHLHENPHDFIQKLQCLFAVFLSHVFS